MSYAAEPYAQFVDDLLTALTGGFTRQEFRFLSEARPFVLLAPGPVIPATVRVFGQADGVFRRFRVRTDYVVGPGFTIDWQQRPDGTPAADAVWPDEGTIFYVNFEALVPGGPAPLLTDRNPGSVTRLLAESFGREFAVFSKQLEAVYRAGFLDLSTGRDLDQLVTLVGVTRRGVTNAVGTAVFSRGTPAPADISIPAGTRISAADASDAVFETIQDTTLTRGNLSVEIPIQALTSGASGVVPAQAITVIHRPILGIDTVSNPQATRFLGSSESDENLRSRTKRALETAGQATIGALLGALTTIPGLREKDVQLLEDPLASPGVVKINVVLPDMDPEDKLLAVELIERTRPVGVRIIHNIDAARPAGGAVPGPNIVPEGSPPVGTGSDEDADLLLPVDFIVRIQPTTLSLAEPDRLALVGKAEKAVRDFAAEAGLGEVLVYNRLVAQLMALPNVLDVATEMYPSADPGQPHHKNLIPDNPSLKPVANVVDVQIGGSLILLDIAVTITLKGAGLLGDPVTASADARNEVESQLRTGLLNPPFDTLSVTALKSLLIGSENYTVPDLHYKVEYQDAGVRIHQQDVNVPFSGLEQLWVRRVDLL
jgi:hypothetical protein